jgi:serine protease Do
MAVAIGTLALAGILIAGPDEARGQQGNQATSFAGPPSFADVVEQVSPAVVTVAVTMQPVAYQTSAGVSPFSGTPFEDFFGGFGVPDQRVMPLPRKGEGSGFIIDGDGYIATNNHVVEGATEVTVTLANGEQLEARVVGTDPRTDLALIKVDEGHDLPALALGDSDHARIGDWVLAIGNPFGLGGTATAGIISARGRDIQAGYYDDFLQIDAAINSGNSGGPVFNAAGEVIGINTAIYSPTGGSVGIGFAIPANQAQDVLEDLRDDGAVTRGWLGVQMVVDEEGRTRGVQIDDVFAYGPADLAGLERGDVITRFDGKAIEASRDLSRLVASLDAGDEVEIEVMRGGEHREFTARLGQREEERVEASLRNMPQQLPEQLPPNQPGRQQWEWRFPR